jgi:hypothetical protein
MALAKTRLILINASRSPRLQKLAVLGSPRLQGKMGEARELDHSLAAGQSLRLTSDGKAEAPLARDFLKNRV